MKRFILVILILLFALVATSCRSNDATIPEPEPDVEEYTPGPKDEIDYTINVWSASDEFLSIIERFMEMHPEYMGRYDVNLQVWPTTDMR